MVRMGRSNNSTMSSTSTDESTMEESSSDGIEGTKMFDGLTAWFSKSVSEERKTSWIKNDGLVTSDINEAMFVFSEDAGCEDTSCLYKTRAYLDEHLAIFHPAYVDKCLEEADIKKVAVGKYFMPPAEIQKEIQNNTKFIWHTHQGATGEKRTISENQSTETTVRPSAGNVALNTPTSSKQAQYPDYVHIDDLEQVEGDIEDFVIGEKGCCVYKRTQPVVPET